MRLFFVIILTQFLLPLSGHSSYIPFALYDRGEAVLTEDIFPGSRKTRIRCFALGKGEDIRGGADFVSEIFLPEINEPHYRGEIISFRTEEGGGRRRHILLFRKGEYMNGLNRIRGVILERLEETFLSLGSPGMLLEALILGKKYGAEYMNDLFRNAGVSHLLALSGLHVGLVAGVIYTILRLFVPSRYRNYVTLLFLSFYAWLVGLNYSFLRAVVMFGLVSLLKPWGIKLSPLKLLLSSAVLQSVLWSDCLTSWSFWLSYGAMGGIVLFSSFWLPLCKRILPDLCAYPLGVSLAAQTALVPLILLGFGTFRPAGIAAGLVMTPLITFYLTGGIVLLPLLLAFPAFAGICYIPFQAVYGVLEEISLIFGRFPCFELSRPSGKILLFLSISAILGLLSLLIIKEIQFVRKNSQAEL